MLRTKKFVPQSLASPNYRPSYYRPSCEARMAASARDFTPSLSKMCLTWTFTVHGTDEQRQADLWV